LPSCWRRSILPSSRCRDVEAVVVKGGVKNLELSVVEELGNFIAEQAPLLQASHVGLESQGLVAAIDIEAGDIQTYAGAHARRAGGVAGAGGQTSFKFQAGIVGKGVALGFLDLNHNILLRVRTLRILHRGIDLAEDAKVVKFALSIEQILLAEGLAGRNLNLALHYVWAGVIEAADHHLADKKLFALLNDVGDILAAGLGA